MLPFHCSISGSFLTRNSPHLPQLPPFNLTHLTSISHSNLVATHSFGSATMDPNPPDPGLANFTTSRQLGSQLHRYLGDVLDAIDKAAESDPRHDEGPSESQSRPALELQSSLPTVRPQRVQPDVEDLQTKPQTHSHIRNDQITAQSPDQSDEIPVLVRHGASTYHFLYVPDESTQVCTACTETVPSRLSIRADCGHAYCRTCVGTLFDNAVSDEASFPAQCCNRAIPIDRAHTFLSQKMIQDYHAKALEYGTRDRTYCHIDKCSTFIAPVHITEPNMAICQACQQRTCSMCKQAYHGVGVCPEDHPDQNLERFAAQQGLQKCSRCNAIVERASGCMHIVCRCGHQFCYTCGETWGLCSCDP